MQELFNREYRDIGFPTFVPTDDERGAGEWREMILKGNWIPTIWNSIVRLISDDTKDPEGRWIFLKVADIIHEHGGLVLEMCAGPAGGFAVPVLLKYPNTHVIINDISTTVVGEWQAHLATLPMYENVRFAAFDICDIPFKDNSLDVISSHCGFINIEGDPGSHEKALKEIYRVLKPGGLYISDEVYVPKEYSDTLDPQALATLMKHHPIVFQSYYDECRAMGFSSVTDEVWRKWSNKNDDSGLATLCRSLNIELIFDAYLRCCIK